MSAPTSSTPSSATSHGSPLVALTPAIFVLLWSTGFIGARLGLPHAEPFTFLFIRFVLVTLIAGLGALALGARWPRSSRETWNLAVVGILIHGIYLGGVFAAIKHGLPAGVTALLVGMQPLLTAALAVRLLGEQVKRQQWIGLALGLAGVALVVADKLSFDRQHLIGIGCAFLALGGITAGTLYQKRHGGGMSLSTTVAVQYAAATVVYVPLVWFGESGTVDWTGEFIFALAWLVLVLSIGALSLFYILLRRGAASRVSSLFYLVPPVTSLIAWVLFGDHLGPIAIVGMAVAAFGVHLATKT